MNRYAFVFLLVLLSTVAVFASSVPAPNYGTAAETAYVLTAFDLDAATSAVGYGYFNAGRYQSSDSGGFVGTLRLPAGASVTRLKIDACDNSGTGQVQAYVARCTSPFNSCIIFSQVATGPAFTDGGSCTGTFENVLASPETIDNQNNIYIVSVANVGNFTSSTRINAVRIYYKLQVSPPPGVATFADVPTSHPFFQYIEALVAAGITGGCNAPPLQYCPDNFITRGQMAVFLSRALGLHWAP